MVVGRHLADVTGAIREIRRYTVHRLHAVQPRASRRKRFTHCTRKQLSQAHAAVTRFNCLTANLRSILGGFFLMSNRFINIVEHIVEPKAG